MEYAEEPVQTARRETREETGLDVAVEALIGAYPGTDDPRVRVVLLVYRARLLGGRMRAGDDADDIGVFGLDSLPAPMAFRAHRLALRDYRRLLESARDVAARTTARTRRAISHGAGAVEIRRRRS